MGPLLPVSVKRVIPRQQKELRRWSFDWAELFAHLKAENTYTVLENNLTISVISLDRARERKDQTISSLRQQAVSYEKFEAVDGLYGFDDEALFKYAGNRRLKRLRAMSGKSYQEAKEIYSSIDDGRIDRSLKESLHESLRFGCLLSHVMLWNEMQRKHIQQLVVLEDDVTVAANFTSRVISVLHSLPESWDLLYLNGCFKKYGPHFALGVTLSRGGLCTFGYVISSRGANKLLLALEYSDKPIDHMIEEEVLKGKVIAFHADPPLVESIASIKSTLAYFS